MKDKLKVFLVDDESLALRRLSRLLSETGRVEIAGQTTEPLEALKMIPKLKLDALFLDIQMPELTGFELLQKLELYPPVVFTTAFDEFALKAFDVFSIDYLLKPIEGGRLDKAIQKLDKLSAEKPARSVVNIEKLLANLNTLDRKTAAITRIASRIGGKVQILDVSEIAFFSAQQKVTFAGNVNGKKFPLDDSLSNLEKKLDNTRFIRIHRSSIVNLDFIEEVHGWFSGRVLIRLKDPSKTELVVARDRVKVLKDLLGM